MQAIKRIMSECTVPTSQHSGIGFSTASVQLSLSMTRRIKHLRKREDEQHKTCGAEEDANPVHVAVVGGFILGDRIDSDAYEDAAECGLEYEDVSPTSMQLA